MRFKYITKSENGDATKTYDLEGSFPCKFIDFLEWVLKNDASFRICFRLRGNKIYADESIEVIIKNDKAYIYKDQKALLEEIKNIDVTGCWANGGWGQMSYDCSLAEEPEKAEPTETPERKKLLQLICKAKGLCDMTECMTCRHRDQEECEEGFITDYLLANGVTVPLAADEGNEVEQADWKTSMMQHFTKVE